MLMHIWLTTAIRTGGFELYDCLLVAAILNSYDSEIDKRNEDA